MKSICTLFIFLWLVQPARSQNLVSINPSTGTAGNTLTAQLTASGMNFMSASPPGARRIDLSRNNCLFVEGVNFQVIDDDHITVDLTLPADATNAVYDVLLATEANPFQVHTLPASFTVTGGVSRDLQSVSPSTLQAGDTTTTLVQGQNIQDMVNSGTFVISIKMGGEQYSGFNISPVDPDHINVDFAPVPWSSNGSFDLHVECGHGCFTLTQAVLVQGGLPRALLSINPAQGAAGGPLTAQLTGQHLYFMTSSPSGVNQVRLTNSNCNEIEGTNFNVIDDDHVDVDFDIPVTATNGAYDVHLVTNGAGSYTLPSGFTVTNGYNRSLVSITPDSALAGSLYTALISGTDVESMLDSTTVIRLAGPANFIVNGANVNVIDPDNIEVDFALAPYAENGMYNLSITSDIAGCYSLSQAVEISGGAFRGILSINPYEAYKGQTLTAQITGQYVQFMSSTAPTNPGGILEIHLHYPSGQNIQGTNINVIDTDHVDVDFTIPFNAQKGFYDVMMTTVERTYTLANGFEVKGTVMSGQVYFDIDSNGVKNGPDHFLANRRVLLLPDSVISFTDASGTYHFSDDPGSYTIEIAADTNWYTTSLPVVYPVTISNTDTTGLNFGINPVYDDYELIASLTGTQPRCNNNRAYTISYSNYSTTSTHGTVTLELDSDLVFVSSIPPPDLQTGYTLEWEYDSLLVFETRSIQVTVLMPPLAGTVLNSFLCVTAEDAAGNPFTEDCDTLSQVVTCSVDPNDKTVYPEGVYAQHYVLQNNDLDYLVRFQNTGTDTAFTVMILDTIDADLDLNTLQLIAWSHPVTVTILPERVVEFRFTDILLPDSNVDEMHSHGFVRYRIRALSGIPDPCTITNTAGIYFDLNAPVLTNTVFSTLVTSIPTGIPEVKAPEGSFIIYPNPVTGVSTILFSGFGQKEFETYVHDVTGRIVDLIKIRDGLGSIQKKNLPSGLYLLMIHTENGVRAGRFVIE